MDDNDNIKDKTKIKEKKKSKDKKTTSKKVKKNAKQLIKLSNKKDKLESEKNNENIKSNEKKEIIIQKEGEETNVKNNKSETRFKNKEIRIDSSKNIELKLQIKEKIEKIKELSLSQKINKKSLTDLLKKVSLTIESNADILYSEYSNNCEDKDIKIKKLEEILERRKIENNKLRETNRKYKIKYENIMKDMNISSVDKLENLHKRINALKENNSILSKEISLINHKNNVDKMISLNPKYRVSDIKKYSDEYITLTKEKYKHYKILKDSKILIKDVIQKFQNLIQIINEKKEEIKNLDLDKEISKLKEDLSGGEENIYNKIILDKTIILENYYKKNNIKENGSTDNLKSILSSRTKKFHLKNKVLSHSKSSIGLANIQKKEDNNPITS